MTNSTTYMNTCEQPASASRTPIIKFLVVCGAHDVCDAWFFGNFVGFCRALQLLGVNGEFWSCFPIQQYFEKWESVKFGEKGSGNTAEDRQELAIFTKADFNDQKTFWKHWDSTRRRELPVAVLAFIVKLSKKSEAGDIFNLILMSHGDTERLQLGGQALTYSALADALGKLKSGVRVNVFVQSCHSGAFVEIVKAKSQRQGLVHASSRHDQSSYSARLSVSGRHRNSQFNGAFPESLGLAVDPNASSWTIEGHLQWVQRFGKGSGSIPKAASNSNHKCSRDVALVTKFIDVLFTDYEDRQFVQAANMARRVLTPQHSTMPPNSLQVAIASEPLQNAVESIAREVEFRGEYDDRDAGLASYGTGAKWLFENEKMTADQYQKHVLEQMRGLRWRFRLQENFYVAMAKLSDRGLIDFAPASDLPVDWDPSTKPVSHLIEMLKSFSLVQECTRLGGGADFQRLFDSPVYWLAIIIARTCTDINRTFRYLATSRWLGDFDRAHYRAAMPKFVVQSAEQGLSMTRTMTPPQIGFWLPCDTSSGGVLAAIIGESMTRYRKFRTAYEGCYGHGSWGENFFFDQYIEVLMEDTRY